MSFVQKNVYKMAMFSFAIFWIIKPFYLMPSGTFQIGDLFLVLSFCLICCKECFKVKAIFDDIDKLFRLFLLFVLIINTIYGVYYKEMAFFRSSLYFVFNYMVIITFRKLYLFDEFLLFFEKCCKLNLWIQFIVFLFQWGKWFEPGRYMGTYNDPNQFGFAVITTYLILFCINQKTKTRYNWVYFIVSSFLVIKSASMGCLLLILVFVFIISLYKIVLLERKKRFKVVIGFLGGLIAIGVLLALIDNDSVIIEQIEVFVARVLEKFEKFQQYGNHGEKGTLFDLIIYDRNLSAIANHPISFLYGSGEGLMNRYAASNGEPHCTWLAIPFYYGAVPTVFLVKWIWNNLKGISLSLMAVYVALFIEALTVINYRQAAFWILLILGSAVKNRDQCE